MNRLFLLCLALGLLCGARSGLAAPEVWVADTTGQRPDWSGLALQNPEGQPVSFSQYLADGKPLLLGLIYFNCPATCSVIVNRTLQVLQEAGIVPGQDVRVAFLSFDARETLELAQQKKASYSKRFPGAQSLEFRVGQGSAGPDIARRLGFRFAWDPRAQMFEHGTALYWIDAQGAVRRILLGRNLNPEDLKLAVREMTGQSLGLLAFDRRSSRYRVRPEAIWGAGSGLFTASAAGVGLAVRRRRRKRG